MMLHGVLDKIMPAYRQLFTRFGVTEQQWRVLRVLWNQARYQVSRLAAKPCLPRTALSEFWNGWKKGTYPEDAVC